MTLQELEERRRSLPSPLDVTGTRAQEEVFLQRRVLDARITEARVATQLLAELEAEIEPRVRWRDHLIEWRKVFAGQLLTCPIRPDTRQQQDQRSGLVISITAIDRNFNFGGEMFPPNLPLFELMRTAGYAAPTNEPWNLWRAGYGCLPAVEQRLGELMKRRDDTQARLDAALRDSVLV